MSKTATRLIKQFKPQQYNLQLSINHTQLTFSGTVTIIGNKVGPPSKRLTFHQNGLRITDATIQAKTKKNESKTKPSRIYHHKKLNEVRLHSDTTLYPGHYTISISFSGKISQTMLGIYPSRFKHNKKEEIIIATQFESHHAREAFPCIDEPEAKATFNLTLETDQKLTTLSNTPIIQQHQKNDRLITSFEETPKMSTYLLAFVIGKLHSVSTKNQNGVTVTSWAAINRPKKELKYSVQEAAAMLDFYNDYFQVPYPLKKYDQVALPDFDSGAMENWGLITYRETALLDDPDNSSITNKQFVSLVIAHELSHQWFGNLVTMRWWDDLWLNESFASIMEYIALDAMHPDWHVWEQYVSSDVLTTANRDIYKDIQPVGVRVTDPDLIHTLFDPGIVYAKGGRLLKMIKEYIGEEAFKRGLKEYFTKHAYNNTTREDLWHALETASNKDISKILTPWITQPGMPKLSINKVDGETIISQERFMLDSPPDQTLWPIPLLKQQSSSTELLTQKQQRIKSVTQDVSIYNPTASGHFITQYVTDIQQKAVAKAIIDRTIPAESRINTINDMLLLARHGDQSLVDVLKIVTKCSKEPRDNVWSLIGRALGYAAQLTEGDETTEDLIRQTKNQLMKDWYLKLGWEDKTTDDPNTKQLRHTAVAYMLASKDDAALNYAQERIDKTKYISELPAELRPSILSAIMRHRYQDSLRNELLRQYEHAAPDIQADIVAGLGSVTQPKQAEYIISHSLDKDIVRAQDMVRWIVIFLRNYHIRETMWQWVDSNWHTIERKLGDSKSLDYVPIYMAAVVSTPKGKERFKTLFDPKKDDKSLQRNISIGQADIDARIAWRERDEHKIKDFFKGQLKKR